MVQPSEQNPYVRARALVSSVYRLPETERDRYLEEQCADDKRLREEVAWLLDVLRSPDDDDFLEKGPDDSGSFENDELHVAKPHDYNLVRQLGEGGMGVVWLAERVDEGEFRQNVALKLLNTAALSNQATVARFLSERQLLARLNHPNIAHLVDAGALSDGRPFLAMEYIDGRRLDEYCDAEKLSIEQRLRLFVKICLAVQYAHEQLIIHRDIKPANILVTADGEPKLLDFGIARVVASAEVQLSSTAAGFRIMTLAYASPEQIEGRTLSTATDVYSLGVVLYELLTGVHPWGDTTNPAEIVRLVSRSDPERPSAVRRRRLQKTDERATWLQRWRLGDLPRDLDVIALKALGKSPSERYSSPRALADDLGRFLENRPIEARRTHQWYRLRKFARRNRAALVTAAAILLLIIGFAANRQVQLDRTRAEQIKTQQVRDFLVDLFAGANLDETQGRDITAREIVDRGVDKIHQSLGNDPATKATLLGTLAATYRSLGLRDKAKSAANEALALARNDPNTTHDATYRLLMTLTSIYSLEQDSTEQERYATEALALARSDGSLSAVYAPAAIEQIAIARARAGKPRAEVEPLFVQAVDGLKKAAPDSGELIDTWQSYGTALRNWDNPKDGLVQLKFALDAAVAKYGEEDARTVQVRADYGVCLERSGDAVGSEAVLRRAFNRQVELYGADNPSTSYVRGYLAFALMSQNKWVDAEVLLRKTLEMGRKYDKPGISTFNNVMNEAFVLRKLGRFAESSDLYREALTLIDVAFSPETHVRWHGTVNAYLGQTLREEGKLAEAKTLLDQALVELPHSDDSRRTRAVALRGLGAIALAKHDTTSAEADARAALELYDKDTWFYADAAIDVAEALVALGRSTEAQSLLLASLETLAKEFPPTDARVLRAARTLAAAYDQQGDTAKASAMRSQYGLAKQG
ncbi:MAG TPA: serine/threonine-protein kinase [Rudaea sp.]|nr:serine/threonine-protein kinase [Rudaea sp.]